jgi:hypothetical protein
MSTVERRLSVQHLPEWRMPVAYLFASPLLLLLLLLFFFLLSFI